MRVQVNIKPVGDLVGSTVSLLRSLFDKHDLTMVVDEFGSFVNLSAKQFPGFKLRIQNGRLFYLYETVPEFKFNHALEDVAKNLKKIDKILTFLSTTTKELQDKDFVKFMKALLDWTSNPGNQNAGKQLMKYVRFTKGSEYQGPLYRGMTLPESIIDSLLSGNKFFSKTFTSFASSEKIATQFAKGLHGNFSGIEHPYRVVFKLDSSEQGLRVVLSVPKFVAANKDAVILAEAGVYGGEPGTLHLDEVIVHGYTLTKNNILKLWKKSGTSWRLVKL